MHISSSTLVLYFWTVFCSRISDHVTFFLTEYMPTLCLMTTLLDIFSNIFFCCSSIWFLCAAVNSSWKTKICLLTLTFLNQWDKALLLVMILTAWPFSAFVSGFLWTSGGMLAVWKYEHLTPQRPTTAYASHHCSRFNASVEQLSQWKGSFSVPVPPCGKQ